MGWHQTRSAAYNLIGQHSFTAGVVVGMGENLAKTVVAAVDLLQTLALAEYWESRQDHSFMARMRSSVFFSIAPGASLGMVVAGHFWPGFDRKAQEAYEERGAIADAIKHAFTHPKEFLGSLTKAQEAKAREFVAFMGQQSLSGIQPARVGSDGQTRAGASPLRCSRLHNLIFKSIIRRHFLFIAIHIKCKHSRNWASLWPPVGVTWL
jgi:hypothetical protein